MLAVQLVVNQGAHYTTEDVLLQLLWILKVHFPDFHTFNSLNTLSLFVTEYFYSVSTFIQVNNLIAFPNTDCGGVKKFPIFPSELK